MVANIVVISFDGFHIILGMVGMGKNGVSHNKIHKEILIETHEELLLVSYYYAENVLSTSCAL